MRDVPLNILLVEDDPAHAEIISRSCETAKLPNRIVHLTNGEAALDYLYRRGAYASPSASLRPDLVLLDLRLPRIDGLEVLKTVKADPALAPIPIVILTSSAADQDIAKAYNHRVDSYLVKPVSAAQLHDLLETLGIGRKRQLEVRPAEQSANAVVPPGIRLLVVEDEPAHIEAIRRTLETSPDLIDLEIAHTLREYRESVAANPPDIALLDLKLPDGSATELLTTPNPEGRFPLLIMTSYGDQHTAVESIKAGAIDYFVKSPEFFATLARTIESALRKWKLIESHNRYESELAAIYANVPVILMLVDQNLRVCRANDLAARFAGHTVDSLTGLSIDDVFPCSVAPAGGSACESEPRCPECTIRQAIRKTLATGVPAPQLEAKLKTTSSGEVRECNILLSTTPLFEARGRRVLVSIVDITERKKIEANLMQTQRMESVGRLAGGVAHDFNNLLTVINGYSDLLLATADEGSMMRTGLEQIRKAGERAASLTRQLLAYSRTQHMQPHVVELNAVVREMEPVLPGLAGEDVELRIEFDHEQGKVLADPHQLEQVVLNLVLNARDAMPRGGHITIRVGCVEWRGVPAANGVDANVGRYVMLSVTDSGVGMTEELQRHIFEPFFTTKEVGKGTGLGLSMAHGVVAQSGGFMQVDSEPGHGAKISVYLPRVTESGHRAQPVSTPGPPSGGTEKILVVEDQSDVRAFVTNALTGYGYEVIEASDGIEALRICEREGGQIDAVVTDVVMPNMSGRELASTLSVMWPSIKVLYMSGYSNDTITNHGILEFGTELLQKPFSAEELARRLRELLEP